MTTDVLASHDLTSERPTSDDVLAVLGDGTRRAIVGLLAERPRPVGELADLLPVTRPAVSLHLKVLKDASLVRSTPVGTRRVYELDRAGLGLLRSYIDRLWDNALTRFASAAEAAHAVTDTAHPAARSTHQEDHR